MAAIRAIAGMIGVILLALAVVAASNTATTVFLAVGGGAGMAGAVLGDTHGVLRWVAIALAASVACVLLVLFWAASEGTD